MEQRLTLILEPISKRLNVATGSTVYDALVAINYPIGALCGGNGTCGKCLIRIIDPNSNLSEPNEKEIKSLGKDKIKDGYRLACQAKVLGDSRIFLTETLMQKSSKILVDSDLENLNIIQDSTIKPFIHSELIKISQPDLKNPRNDLTGLYDNLKEFSIANLNSNYSVNDRIYEISKKLPFAMRENRGDITAYFHNFGNNNRNLFDIESGNRKDLIFGLAVDIGTTTIVGYLIDLKTGVTVSLSAMLNPQVAIGEDLVSRITYIKKYKAQEKAQQLLIGAINDILKDTCRKGKVNIIDVKDIVIVGNTGIHHMFFGLPSNYLAVSPFVPVFKTPINVSASKLGINCSPNVNVYSPPVIAGYVGTDTIGCVVSARMDQFDKYTLLIDIGTNGEIVLGNNKKLITGSCAAGSALEGAHIKCGMRASEGSIEQITINPTTLDPSLGIIGDLEPVGICGSGLIDVIAEMLRAKIITRAGRFNKKALEIMNNKRIVNRNDEYAYIVYKREWDYQNLPNFDRKHSKPSSIDEIIISQSDIRQIQLAKGAFLSGANILLDHDKKQPTDVEQMILAGAFGTYINKKNAAFIGLFPDISSGNIFQIGNAAGLGAQLCIKNRDSRNFANKIAHEIEYHEVASSPKFQKEYAYSLYFPHYKIEQFPSLKEEYKNIPFK